jgi:hypothetical protein
MRHSRLVPSNFNGFFHRAKAEEWCMYPFKSGKHPLTLVAVRRQMAMATGSMHGLSAVTGLQSSLLMYRPFFAPWFMAQISRYAIRCLLSGMSCSYFPAV